MSAMSDVLLCGGDCVEDVNRSKCPRGTLDLLSYY